MYVRSNKAGTTTEGLSATTEGLLASAAEGGVASVRKAAAGYTNSANNNSGDVAMAVAAGQSNNTLSKIAKREQA